MVDLDQLERILIRAAREGRSVTYGELLAFLERRVTRITVGALCRDLGRLERRREGQGWPDLACLVVRKTDRLPGEGYFASLRAEGGYDGPSDGPEALALIRARQAAAFAWAAREGGGSGQQAPAPDAITPPRGRRRTRARCRPA